MLYLLVKGSSSSVSEAKLAQTRERQHPAYHPLTDAADARLASGDETTHDEVAQLSKAADELTRKHLVLPA